MFPFSHQKFWIHAFFFRINFVCILQYLVIRKSCFFKFGWVYYLQRKYPQSTLEREKLYISCQICLWSKMRGFFFYKLKPQRWGDGNFSSFPKVDNTFQSIQIDQAEGYSVPLIFSPVFKRQYILSTSAREALNPRRCLGKKLKCKNHCIAV